MSSLVNGIARRAKVTFSRNITEEEFTENLNGLIASVSSIRAADLEFSPDTVRIVSNGDTAKPSAPVTYIEIEETETFSMGIFLLKRGSRIPLHDHPGMHGVLKVIQGVVEITSYSAVSNIPGYSIIPEDITNRIKSTQIDSLVPVEKYMYGKITDKDKPCVFRPREGNYHEICAVDGTAAFLDILAPPYDMKERNCNYYTALETNKPDSEVKTWLLERPPPSDFRCNTAPYTGPKVSL